MKNKVIKLILSLIILLIIIDQISKVVIQYNYTQPIEKGIFEIVLIQNTGMAFGINNGNTKNIILTTLILLIVVNFIRNQKDSIDTKTAVALAMILAGGISNLMDRIFKGGVIDFIKIKNFSIFNIADCYIVFGWILLVIFVIEFNQKIGEVEKCEKQ